MADEKQTPPPKPPPDKGQTMQETMRSWVMMVLTFLFVLIYIGALAGLIPSPNTKQDPQTLSRIESIVFVIIGYYFGRLPAQATEQSLKEQVNHQTGKADQAEQDKTAALQDKQGLLEKVKNAKAALSAAMPEAQTEGLSANLSKASPTSADALRHSMVAAAKVLES